MEARGNDNFAKDIKTLFKGLTNPEPNILAIKGFVHSVDWDKAENAEVLAEFNKFVQLYDVLSFDGDLKKRTSYTYALSAAMEMYPSKILISYKKAKSAFKLHPGYKVMDYQDEATGYSQDLYIRLMDNSLNDEQIGNFAIDELKELGNLSVCFLGGGPIAMAEFKKYQEMPGVSIYWFNVVR